MIELVNIVWTLIGVIVAVALLGIFAGLKPMTYDLPVPTLKKENTGRHYIALIIAGILLAIIFLSVLFQFFQLATLVAIAGSANNALFINVIFNLVVGGAFIAAGLRYVRKKSNIGYSQQTPLSLGFFRTLTNLSAVIATFIVSGLISNMGLNSTGRIVLTTLFLVAAIAPLILVVLSNNGKFKSTEGFVTLLKKHATSSYVRSAIGVVAVLFGSAIILLNVLLAISYQ